MQTEIPILLIVDGLSPVIVYQMKVCFMYAILSLLLDFVISSDQFHKISKKAWETQYESGEWNYLDQFAFERARVSVVAVFITRYISKTSTGIILDVGCGEGILSEYLSPELKDRYVGIDISGKAVAMAREKRKVHAYEIPVEDFSLSSLQPYNINALSDGISVVVFNEVLYYAQHRIVLQKFQRLLNPDGVILLSNWFAPGGSRPFIDEMLRIIFTDTSNIFKQKDQIVVTGIREDSKDEVAAKIGVFVHKTASDNIKIETPPQPPPPPKAHNFQIASYATSPMQKTKQQQTNQQSYVTQPVVSQPTKPETVSMRGALPKSKHHIDDLAEEADSTFDNAFRSNTVVKHIPLVRATAKEIKDMWITSQTQEQVTPSANAPRQQGLFLREQDSEFNDIADIDEVNHSKRKKQRMQHNMRQQQRHDNVVDKKREVVRAAANTAGLVQNINGYAY